ncbi:MAG: hypothetical protein IID61_08085, partial [SAR324 cluster bacterium]|nr:hypothetical protein [SAR324 cluster bacterium]
MGSTFDESTEQTQGEILAIFNVAATDIPDFDTLDFEGSGTGNAVLIAVSAILMQAAHDRSAASGNSVEAEMQDLLVGMAEELNVNGTLNNQNLLDQLREAAIGVDMVAVRANLEDFYAVEGEIIPIAAFEDYVDTDGDGILPLDDDNTPDAFTLSPKGDAEPGTLVGSDPVVISGITGDVLVRVSNGRLYKNCAGGDLANCTAEPVTTAGDETAGSGDLTVALATNGDELVVAVTAGAAFGGTVSAALEIGTGSGSFELTTCAVTVCYPDAVVFVDGTGGNDTAIGDITRPLATIQAGTVLAASFLPYLTASDPAPQVHVAMGSYSVDYDAGTQIALVEGVSLYGGYDATDWGAARNLAAGATVVEDPNIGGGEVLSPTRVVEAGSGITTATRFDGFTVNARPFAEVNAAVVLDGGSPTLTNNTINGGESFDVGYAVYVVNGAQPVIGSLSLGGNTIYGGADGNATIGITALLSGTHVTIVKNTIIGGLGVASFAIRVLEGASATITDNPVISGGTGEQPTGIDIFNPGSVEISNNGLITGGENVNELFGGFRSVGIVIDDDSDSDPSQIIAISGNFIDGGRSQSNSIGIVIRGVNAPTISSNTIFGTAATGSVTPSSAYGIQILGSPAIISGNTAIDGGTASINTYGIFVDNNAAPKITNNAIVGGTAGWRSYGLYIVDSSPDIVNNLIHGG